MMRYLLVATLALALAACGDDSKDSNTDNNGNNGEAMCGDGTCDGAENADNCAEDCAAPNNGTNNGENNGTNNGENNGTNNGENNGANNGAECVDDELGNTDPGNAASVALGDNVEAHLCPDADDYFTIELAEGDLVSVAIQFDSEQWDVDLAVFEGTEFDEEKLIAVSQSTSDNEQVTFTAAAAGTYLISVYGYVGEGEQPGADLDYSLTVSAGCNLDADCAEGVCNHTFAVGALGGLEINASCGEAAASPCGDDGEEPNDSDSAASPLDLDLPVPGHTCVGDNDWFSLTLAAGDSLSMTATPAAGGALLGLLLHDGTEFITGAIDETPSAEALFLPAGDYLILVTAFEGAALSEMDYTLDVALTGGGCQANVDCAEVGGRPFCLEGVCDELVGDGAQGLGEACDTADDCTEDADLCYTGAGSADGWICTAFCRTDAHCADLGDAGICNVDAGICQNPCTVDSECAAAESCLEGSCQSCTSDDVCEDREGQVCLTNNFGAEGRCAEAPENACAEDEPNDSYATATVLTLAEGMAGVTDLDTCASDRDYFVIELVEAGNLNVMVDFQTDFPTRCDINPCDPADLDIYVVELGGESAGRGISSEETTEQAVVDFLAPGTYAIRVVQYSEEEDITATYDISVAFEAATCSDASECAATGSRLNCEDGACIALDGGGEIALGDACDSLGDCVLDAETCFVGTGPEDEPLNVCTVTCAGEEDCAAVPGTSCADTGFEAFCLPL
jgi:hypothetical protein